MHASPDILTRKCPARGPRRDNATWSIGDLSSVWESQRDVVGERLAVIERATHALAQERLDAALEDRARRAAHMLAGSLGMFGFEEATRAARELESRLSHPSRACAPALADALAQIRYEVGMPTPAAA